MPTLNHNHGQLTYHIRGQGEPVIFIHGFTLDYRMWQPQADALSATHQVITYDVRGFGQSSTPSVPYNHHDDLKALLEHLGLDSAHIIGLSMGGRIAVNFALTYPDKVRSITLMDSALDDFPDPTDWRVHARKQGIEQAKVNWLNHPLFNYTRTNPVATKLCTEIFDSYSGWHWLNSDPQTPKSTHAYNRLTEIACPTLILVGQHDLPYFHDIATYLHHGIKNSRLVTVENAGHMINLEQPEIVNLLLERFFVSF